MKWIVIWWVVSCVPCDSYFKTQGKEPCHEPKKTRQVQTFNDFMEAAAFTSEKIADGYEAENYALTKEPIPPYDDNAQWALAEKFAAINLLQEFANIPDEKAEKLGMPDVVDFVRLDELIQELKNGEIEFIRYKKVRR